MKIKNISAFLSAAVIVSSMASVNAYGHDEAPAADKGITSTVFKHITADRSEFHALRASNIAGEEIKILPGALLEKTTKMAYQMSMGGNFALNGIYQDKPACMIFTDPMPDHPDYIPMMANNEAYSVIDRQSYLYFVVAHEMSHCMNHNFFEHYVAMRDAYAKINTDDYLGQIGALDTSIREVHSDLTAVLLGASKTGDWTVFKNAVMPIRTGYFDPTHSTLNGVANIINGVNPVLLKGQSFETITALSNELFKLNFMNSKNQIDPNSKGIKNILKEWYATSLETETYIRQSNGPSNGTQEQVLDEIEVYRNFSMAMMDEKELKDRSDLTFFYALKSITLENQNSEIGHLMRNKPADGQNLIISNQGKINNLGAILNITKDMHFGKSKSIDEQKAMISAWQSHFIKQDNSRVLGDSLPRLLGDAFAPPGDEQYAKVVQVAEQRVKDIFASALASPGLDQDLTRTVLSAAVSPQQPQPSIHSEKPKSLFNVFSLGR